MKKTILSVIEALPVVGLRVRQARLVRRLQESLYFEELCWRLWN